MRLQRSIRRTGGIIASVLFTTPLAMSAPGDLDPTFGTGGKVTTLIGGAHDYGYGVALQPDGKIVVGGYAWFGGVSDLAAARYDSAGALDPTFDTDGKVSTDFGGHDLGYAIALQSNGRVVVGGVSNAGGTNDFALVRYMPDGTPDTTFDLDGRVVTDFAGVQDEIRALAIQDNGRIVAVGSTGSPPGQDMAIVRYLPDGSLDTEFDTDGKVTAALGASQDVALAVAIDANQKIVVAGYSTVGSYHQVAVLRYDPDGSLDTTFNGTGWVLTDVSFGNDVAQAIVIQPDGRIVVGGGMGAPDFGVVRYNDDGTLDTSFNLTGMVQTSVSAGVDTCFGLALQSNGRIVAAGFAGGDFGLVRYEPDGTLDATMGGVGGRITTEFGAPYDSGRGVILQADGKIVVAGNGMTTEHFALARFEGDPVPPEIAVFGNSIEIVDGDVTSSVVDDTWFGSVVVAGTGLARTFEIRNDGSGPLTLTGTAPDFVTLSGSGDFTVTSQPASATIPAGGSASFEITFAPATQAPPCRNCQHCQRRCGRSSLHLRDRGMGRRLQQRNVGRWIRPGRGGDHLPEQRRRIRLRSRDAEGRQDRGGGDGENLEQQRVCGGPLRFIREPRRDLRRRCGVCGARHQRFGRLGPPSGDSGGREDRGDGSHAGRILL